MKIGRVIGNLVSTSKNPGLKGKKMLWVQPITPDSRDSGAPILMLDSVGAGYQETVLYVTAKEAAWPFLPESTPSDHTIVGIIDDIQYLPNKPGDKK
ncbi:MAG: EutN/CcmL family microcompartment protein [Acidobacteria bacterium]|nr:EutN/CcmL family microcompartment protein [Acidobacteriota bacterium]